MKKNSETTEVASLGNNKHMKLKFSCPFIPPHLFTPDIVNYLGRRGISIRFVV